MIAVVVGGLMLRTGVTLAAVDCTVVASGVAFGEYDPSLPTDDDSTGSITVTCTYLSGGSQRVDYSLSLSTGGNGVYSNRKMAAGASNLDYNLYADPARSQVLGNLSAGTAIITGRLQLGPGVGNGNRTATHTIYGRAPAQQPVDTGAYGDSIVVTLTF